MTENHSPNPHSDKTRHTPLDGPSVYAAWRTSKLKFRAKENPAQAGFFLFRRSLLLRRFFLVTGTDAFAGNADLHQRCDFDIGAVIGGFQIKGGAEAAAVAAPRVAAFEGILTVTLTSLISPLWLS